MDKNIEAVKKKAEELAKSISELLSEALKLKREVDEIAKRPKTEDNPEPKPDESIP